MSSSHFSGPAKIQQPPPVCKKGFPKPPVPPPSGPTLYVEATWKGVDHTGVYHEYFTVAFFVPDLPSTLLTATEVISADTTFFGTLSESSPGIWLANCRWQIMPANDNMSGESPVLFLQDLPVDTPTFLLSNTDPTGQYCTARFYTP